MTTGFDWISRQLKWVDQFSHKSSCDFSSVSNLLFYVCFWLFKPDHCRRENFTDFDRTKSLFRVRFYLRFPFVTYSYNDYSYTDAIRKVWRVETITYNTLFWIRWRCWKSVSTKMFTEYRTSLVGTFESLIRLRVSIFVKTANDRRRSWQSSINEAVGAGFDPRQPEFHFFPMFSRFILVLSSDLTTLILIAYMNRAPLKIVFRI